MYIADLAQKELDAGKHDDGLEHGESLAVTVERLKQVLQQSEDHQSYCHMSILMLQQSRNGWCTMALSSPQYWCCPADDGWQC